MESGHISVTGKEKAETMNVFNLQTNYLHNFHLWLMTAITQQNRTGMKPKTHPIFLMNTQSSSTSLSDKHSATIADWI